MYSFISRLVRPFSVAAESAKIEKNIRWVRIFLGVAAAHRYLDILGFSSLIADTPSVWLWLCIAASVCLAFGVLTPVALGFLIFENTWPHFAGAIGCQVFLIIAWGLLYLTLFGPVNLPLVRFLVVFLYWIITLSAGMYHLSDPIWIEGKVLHFIAETPFVSDFSPALQTWKASSSLTYDFVLKAGLFIQLFWELLLFPLMFSKWGKRFVQWQGLAFFLICLVGINIMGSVALYELCWWLLVFGYRSEIVPSTVRPNPLTPIAWGPTRFSSAVWLAVVLPSLILLVSHSQVNIGRFSFGETIAGKLSSVLPFDGWTRALGVHPTPDLFNRRGLSIGTNYFIVYELDEKGKPLRLVPFLDVEGGRLSYFRNDAIQARVLGYLIRGDQLLKNAAGNWVPSPQSERLVRMVSELDQCVTDPNRKRSYRAVLFGRELRSLSGTAGLWGDHHPLASVEVSLLPAKPSLACEYAFDLRLEQRFASRRTAETMNWLSQNQIPKQANY